MKRGSRETPRVPRETAWGARLRQLGDQHGLSAAQLDQLAGLLEFVADEPTAPTTVTDPPRAVDVHVADSLSVLALNDLDSPAVVADVGSGAGFPALVLAVARPDTRVVAVESVARKCGFIESAADRIGLTNIEVACVRAEAWLAGTGVCDVVCARAVAPLGVLCEYAAPLLRLDGVLVSWKAALDDSEAAAARAACARLGLSEPERIPVEPYPASRNHALFRARKVADTPPGFPRRPGMATKRPLA